MINFQGELWGCDGDDDGNCGDGSTSFWVSYFTIFGVTWILFAARFTIMYPSSAETGCMLCGCLFPGAQREAQARCFGEIMCSAVCSVVWWAFWSWWLLCRAPCHTYNGVVRIRARLAERAALRRRQAAISYLSRFPPESQRRWCDRGWLVMLRARYQAFLAQQWQSSDKSRVWLCRPRAKGDRGITRTKMDDPLAIAGGQPFAARGTQSVADIGLCEEGNSTLMFARAVVSLVDIMEEGLFSRSFNFS